MRVAEVRVNSPLKYQKTCNDTVVHRVLTRHIIVVKLQDVKNSAGHIKLLTILKQKKKKKKIENLVNLEEKEKEKTETTMILHLMR